jgi:hypothetical protein
MGNWKSWLAGLAQAALAAIGVAVGSGPGGADPLVAAVFVLAANKGVNYLVSKLG